MDACLRRCVLGMAIAFMLNVGVMRAAEERVQKRETPARITEADVQKVIEAAKSRARQDESRAKVAARNCREVFGGGVNFDDARLAGALALVAPAPVEQRQSLAGKRVDERLRKWQRPMLERRWIAKGWGPDPDHREPIAFHLRSLDQPLLDSTLYYEWTSQGVTIRVTESSSGALVELQKPGFDLKQGVPRKDVTELLKSVFGIPDQAPVELGSDKLIPLDLGQLFAIPDSLRQGDIFGSLVYAGALRSGFWEWYYVSMGFATDKAICVTVWRPNEPGHLGQKGIGANWAHYLGHFEDPEWLDTAIFEADGKTRIKPPSLTPKDSKRDEP